MEDTAKLLMIERWNLTTEEQERLNSLEERLCEIFAQHSTGRIKCENRIDRICFYAMLKPEKPLAMIESEDFLAWSVEAVLDAVQRQFLHGI